MVAGTYQGSTQKVQSLLDKLSVSLKEIKERIDSSLIDLLCLKIQIDMLVFEIDHIKMAMGKNVSNLEFTVDKKIEGASELLKIVQSYFTGSAEKIRQFFFLIAEAHARANEISKILLNLDLIQTGGLLEGARTELVSESFQPFMTAISHIISDVQKPVYDVKEYLFTLKNDYEQSMIQSRRTEFFLAKAVELHQIFYAEEADSETEHSSPVESQAG